MLRVFFLFTLFLFTLNANNLSVGYSTNSFKELSKIDSEIALGIWFKDMMLSVNHTATFTFYDDITLMADDFDAGKLDLIFANGYELVKYFNISKVRAAFTGGSEDKNADNLVVVTQESSSSASLKELQSLKISFVEGENPSKLYAKSMVLKEYKNREVEYVQTKKYSMALLKLFFKQVDIAIVPKKTFEFAVELNPQLGRKLKMIRLTELTATSLGYFNEGTDEKFRDEVTRLAFNAVKNKRGKQMMLMFKTPTLVKIDVEKLTPIKKLYQDYLKCKGAQR